MGIWRPEPPSPARAGTDASGAPIGDTAGAAPRIGVGKVRPVLLTTGEPVTLQKKEENVRPRRGQFQIPQENRKRQT